MSDIVMNGGRIWLPAAKVFRKVLGLDWLFTKPEIPLGGDEVSIKQDRLVFNLRHAQGVLTSRYQGLCIARHPR